MNGNNTIGTISLTPDDGALLEAGMGSPPAPEMDPADYLPDMEGFDIDKARKIALLETLWSIMRSFIEMGVDISSADLCGQIFGSFEPDSAGGVTSSFSKVTTPTGQNDKKKENTPI